MDVADVMRPFVVTVQPGCAVDDVEQLLLETGFAMVPVVDGARPVGVVGLDDLPLLRAPRGRHEHGRHGTVDGLMTTDVVSVDPDTDLDDLVRLLRITGLTSLPVLAADRLVGVVARRDVADARAERRRTEADAVGATASV